MLCRRLNLFSEAIVAIDGSKFKAVNNRDKNFTANKLKKRMEQLEESIAAIWPSSTARTGSRPRHRRQSVAAQGEGRHGQGAHAAA